MSTRSFLPYARQSIDATDILEVSKALSREMITRGPKVDEFEEAVASYCGVKHAIAFNSGTSALMAAYFAAEVNPYDRLITTPNTFVSTVGAAVQRQAQHIFLDIDRTTGNLNLDQLEYNLQLPASRGKTVIAPIHFAGIAVDMQKIDQMLTDPSTIVIEDAAQAFGSSYADGTKIGSCAWSHLTIFSFHPAKILTTGEGGMATTNDDALAHRLRLFRNNGIERDPGFLDSASPGHWYYEVKALTGNYNFTELQAALGLSQLKRLDEFIRKRRELMALYREKLPKIDHLQLFSPALDSRMAPHLCVAQIDFAAYKTTRHLVMQALKEKGIGTQIHYIPVYRHPYFTKQSGDLTAYFPEMETYYAQALSLPLYSDLSLEDVEYVSQSLKEILQK